MRHPRPCPPRYSVGLLSSGQFDDLGDALEYAVEEQLRGLAGPFITLIQRDEHLRHLTGVPHILGPAPRLRPSNGTGPSAPNSETQSLHCLRYRPPERACFPSGSPWPNCWSRVPDLCTLATTGVGPRTWLKWRQIDLKASSDWLFVVGCTSRTANRTADPLPLKGLAHQNDTDPADLGGPGVTRNAPQAGERSYHHPAGHHDFDIVTEVFRGRVSPAKSNPAPLR